MMCMRSGYRPSSKSTLPAAPGDIVESTAPPTDGTTAEAESSPTASWLVPHARSTSSDRNDVPCRRPPGSRERLGSVAETRLVRLSTGLPKGRSGEMSRSPTERAGIRGKSMVLSRGCWAIPVQRAGPRCLQACSPNLSPRAALPHPRHQQRDKHGWNRQYQKHEKPQRQQTEGATRENQDRRLAEHHQQPPPPGLHRQAVACETGETDREGIRDAPVERRIPRLTTSADDHGRNPEEGASADRCCSTGAQKPDSLRTP